ncbi:MAG: hypothetical protein IJQ50_05525 [Clostridia bacterium]|nr:hypothetical protein [Clostridia bacterium]
MILDLLLQVKFNRPVDEDNDYVVAGGFAMVMNGKAIGFDFEEQEMYIDTDNPCIVTFALRKPLYEEFDEFKDITINDLKNITAISECYIYTGEPGESDLKAVSVRDITFNVICPEVCSISVRQYVIEKYNNSIK